MPKKSSPLANLASPSSPAAAATTAPTEPVGTPPTPLAPNFKRSTIKKVPKKSSPLVNLASPSSPVAPKMARSTVKKNKEQRLEEIVFSSPVITSPTAPQMARSTVKRGEDEARSSIASTNPQPSQLFASPEISTPEAPALLRSTAKKSRDPGVGFSEDLVSPVGFAAGVGASAQSAQTPETPAELQTSFSYSAAKDMAREAREVAKDLDTPSSLGSPDAMTPPVPFMSSVKKGKRTLLDMSTPLLASASKKKLYLSEKKGRNMAMEKKDVVGDLFGVTVEEESESR